MTSGTFPSCTGLFCAGFLILWGPTLSPQLWKRQGYIAPGLGRPARGGAEWLNPAEAEKRRASALRDAQMWPQLAGSHFEESFPG